MKKIFVYTNTNCRRRLLDSNKLRLYFRKNNFEIVDEAQKADLIIFVTCAYRDEITNTCLNKINEFQELDSELIVAGCLPEIEKEKLSNIFKGKKISTKDINDIDKLFPENKTKFSNINDADAIFKEQMKDEIPEESILKNIPWLSFKFTSLKQYFLKHILNEHLLVYLFP